MAAARAQRIDIAANVFRFIWESKPVEIAFDSEIEIPVAPALI